MRKEVRPRVVAICEGGIEGLQHREICMSVAKSLGKYQPIAGYGMIVPFCEKVCWHSCNGESHAGGQVSSKPREPPLAHTLTRLLALFATGRWLPGVPERGLRAGLVPRLSASVRHCP